MARASFNVGTFITSILSLEFERYQFIVVLSKELHYSKKFRNTCHFREPKSYVHVGMGLHHHYQHYVTITIKNCHRCGNFIVTVQPFVTLQILASILITLSFNDNTACRLSSSLHTMVESQRHHRRITSTLRLPFLRLITRAYRLLADYSRF